LCSDTAQTPLSFTVEAAALALDAATTTAAVPNAFLILTLSPFFPKSVLRQSLVAG